MNLEYMDQIKIILEVDCITNVIDHVEVTWKMFMFIHE
jgi:hypothetical protein